MTEEQDLPPNQRPPIYYVQLMLCILCCYLLAILYIAKPIAIHKARNPDNILEGCLYYLGTNFKVEHMGCINNEFKSPLHDMHIKSFPAYKKGSVIPYFDYGKSNHCYNVKYIIVDFNIFTNYSFFKRYYIYDYVDS